MRKVILFKGQSQYDVLRYFVDDMALAFNKIGYQSIIIDLLAENCFTTLEEALNNGDIFFALGMNAMGMEISVEKGSIYDLFNLPFVSFFVDHPIYQLERVKYSSVNNMIFSFVDRNHVSFMEKYIPQSCTKVFIPHGAPESVVRATGKSQMKQKEGLLFTGSYQDPDEIRNQWKNLDSTIKKFCDEISEEFLAHSNLPFENCVQRVMYSRGWEYNISHYIKLIPLLQLVDLYNRNLIRRDVVTKLCKIVPMNIYGNGWNSLSGITATIHSPISFEETIMKMGTAKMSLCVLPTFKHGGHERIFTAALAGSVNIVDYNEYLDEHFKDTESILYYNYQELNSLDRIETLYKNTELLEFMSHNARNVILSGHLWLHRAQQIIDAVKLHKLFHH